MKNWKKVKLGSILTESKVVAENPNTENRIRVKLNVLGIEKRPNVKDKKGATKYYIRKAGQFIYGKQNLHKGAFGIVPQELDGFESSSDIPAFDIDESCYPEWIFYFFKKGNFYLKLENLAKGVGSKRIHPEQIYELDIYLPAKEEQRKVINEIEKAEANNQKLIKEIFLQEENLIKLRQSILQDAFQGKLTTKWRNQNPIVKPVKELIITIKAKKEQLIKENKIKKEKSLPIIKKDEIPFEIPENWSWVRLLDLCEIITKGSSPKWQGLNYVGEEDGVLFITSENVGNYSLLLSKKKYVESKFNEIQSRSILKKNDILMNIVGASIGRTAIYEIEDVANINQAVTIIRLIFGLNHAYFLNFFNSPVCLNYMNNKQVDNGRPNLSMGNISKFLIPIPPIDEQKKIVDSINELQSKCLRLEQEISISKINAEKLMQSYLSELLEEENNLLVNKKVTEKVKETNFRQIKYNSKNTFMDLVKLLQEKGKLHAEDLWKMSKYPDDIDAFYAELKKQIEQEKTIKESSEKGYLELV
jgi:type I restriction enzyme S subunit